jgi:hypothetical protein
MTDHDSFFTIPTEALDCVTGGGPAVDLHAQHSSWRILAAREQSLHGGASSAFGGTGSLSDGIGGGPAAPSFGAPPEPSISMV